MVLCCCKGHRELCELIPVLHQLQFPLRCSSISAELQHLHPSPSSHFPHLRAASTSCPFPPSTGSLHPAWVWLGPTRCRSSEQWHCRGDTTTTPAHPALPKQRGWQHRDCSSGMAHPCGVVEPQSPTSSLGSTQENGKAGFYSDVAKE